LLPAQAAGAERPIGLAARSFAYPELAESCAVASVASRFGPRHPLSAPLPSDAIDRYLAQAARGEAAEWIDPFAVPSLPVRAPGDPRPPGAITQSMWNASP
jgi:hypothetical protein